MPGTMAHAVVVIGIKAKKIDVVVGNSTIKTDVIELEVVDPTEQVWRTAKYFDMQGRRILLHRGNWTRFAGERLEFIEIAVRN